jgi:hypothetical protein
MDDKGSILNVDGPSVLKIELHVPRQELKRKFEMVLLAGNAQLGMKVVQMNAVTYAVNLHEVSSQSNPN